MMRDVFLNHLTFALGSQSRSVEEAEKLGTLSSSAAALSEAGFRQHHVAAAGESAYDLAKSALEPIREHLSETGTIVYATCLPTSTTMSDLDAFRASRDVKCLMDFPASHLQADFGLDRAVPFGLHQQACTGMLGSLGMARAFLLADASLTQVLCLTADRFPEGALYEQSYNLVTDGAAACVVGTAPGPFRLLGWHGITNGALARASDDEVVGSFFSYTHRVIQEALAKHGFAVNDLAWIVPQNMNVAGWLVLAKLLGFPPERVAYPSLPEVGHMVSGDNIVNLKMLHESGTFRPGDKIALATAGYGLHWHCVLLEAT